MRREKSSAGCKKSSPACVIIVITGCYRCAEGFEPSEAHSVRNPQRKFCKHDIAHHDGRVASDCGPRTLRTPYSTICHRKQSSMPRHLMYVMLCGAYRCVLFHYWIKYHKVKDTCIVLLYTRCPNG